MLSKWTPEKLIKALNELSFEIEAWKLGLAEGMYFYGKTNAQVEQQVAEDEAQRDAIVAELERRRVTEQGEPK